MQMEEAFWTGQGVSAMFAIAVRESSADSVVSIFLSISDRAANTHHDKGGNLAFSVECYGFGGVSKKSHKGKDKTFFGYTSSQRIV